MKIESTQITDTTLKENIIKAVEQYQQDIIKTLPEDIQLDVQLSSIKVDLENNNVYIIYKNFQEERKQMTEILQQATTINQDLQEANKELQQELNSDNPDQSKITQLQTKIASLTQQLANLDNQYYNLSKEAGMPMHLYDLL